MISTPLFFGTVLDFSLTLNEQLKEMAAFSFWDRGAQKRMYMFPIAKLPMFQALVESVKFDENDLVAIMRHTKQPIKDVELERWKGKSGYLVLEFPKIYRVIHYQKPNKDGKPKQQTFDVPRERVLKLWEDVILPLDMDDKYDFEELAPKVCKAFGLDRYFKDSGWFQKDKFQGSRGEAYFPYYYFPMKVLQHLGLVSYVGQYVERIKESWDEQTKLNTNDYVGDEEMMI